MKLVLQQDLMRNITKEKSGAVKTLVEEYLHFHVLNPDISSDMPDMKTDFGSMLSSLMVQLGVISDLKDSLIREMVEQAKENKDGID
jgi:hypothetical protein